MEYTERGRSGEREVGSFLFDMSLILTFLLVALN